MSKETTDQMNEIIRDLKRKGKYDKSSWFKGNLRLDEWSRRTFQFYVPRTDQDGLGITWTEYSPNVMLEFEFGANEEPQLDRFCAGTYSTRDDNVAQFNNEIKKDGWSCDVECDFDLGDENGGIGPFISFSCEKTVPTEEFLKIVGNDIKTPEKIKEFHKKEEDFLLNEIYKGNEKQIPYI